MCTLFAILTLTYEIYYFPCTLESSQDCLRDGEKSQYECTIDFREGNLEWNGTGFDCSHRIILPLFKTVDDCHESNPRIRGRCNPYTGVISNCSRSDTNQTSVLTFDADYNLMNGGQIFCTLGDNVIQVFNIRVGGKKLLSSFQFSYFLHSHKFCQALRSMPI